MRVYILYGWLVTPINKFYEATSLILHKKEKIHRKSKTKFQQITNFKGVNANKRVNLFSYHCDE